MEVSPSSREIPLVVKKKTGDVKLKLKPKPKPKKKMVTPSEPEPEPEPESESVPDCDPLSQFTGGLSAQELCVMRIAEEHLETSFDVEKSNGFTTFMNRPNK